jgi:hypothetical protein
MRVKFTADFDWKQPGFTIAFKAGMVENVRRICGDEAIASGKAVQVGKREVADGKST